MFRSFALFWFLGVSLLAAAPATSLEFRMQNTPPAFLKQLFRLYRGEGNSSSMEQGFVPLSGGYGSKFGVIRVSGVVEKGDERKLWEFVKQSKHYNNWLVIDDVPGGNFAEATKIGDLLYNSLRYHNESRFIGVVVPKTGRCDSACAVIGAFAGDRFFIQPGAQVGFHLPFLPKATVEAVNRGPSDVESIMATTYDIALAYSEIGLRDMASAWLVREAYNHRTAESFFFLKTAEDIHRAGFTPVDGRETARPITVQNMRLGALGKICNAEYERSRLPKNRADDELANFNMQSFDRFGSLPLIMKQLKRRWFLINFGYPEDVPRFVCVFGLDSSDRLHVRITKTPPPCIATYKQLPGICAVEAPRDTSFYSKHAYDKDLAR